MDYSIEPGGDSSVFIRIGNTISRENHEKVIRLTGLLESSLHDKIIEIVPSYNGLMIYFNPVYVDHEVLLHSINNSINKSGEVESTQRMNTTIIPVCYEKEYAPDIGHVAEINNISVEKVIEYHSRVEYTVYMLGFMPGFPYLGGLDDRLTTPRKLSPSLKIEAGSVGIADNQTGIYPISSPGGWQIIGRSPMRLFNPDCEVIFPIKPGGILKFKAIGSEEFIFINDLVEKGLSFSEIMEGLTE